MGLADKLLEKPTPKASSPSGGGSWHVVPDGRGICKALGTVDFCSERQPNRTGALPLLQAPSVALRRQLPPEEGALWGMPYGDSLRPATLAKHHPSVPSGQLPSPPTTKKGLPRCGRPFSYPYHPKAYSALSTPSTFRSSSRTFRCWGHLRSQYPQPMQASEVTPGFFSSFRYRW